jgi:hypothetical protein
MGHNVFQLRGAAGQGRFIEDCAAAAFLATVPSL